jgi:enterochelin esterase family protein
VLYLLHGWGENEQGQHTQGHMDLVTDNLIAQKKAKPMIVVMDNLNAVRPGEDASLLAARGVITRASTADVPPTGGGRGNMEKFAYLGRFSGSRGGFDPKTSNNGVFADAAAFN